MGWFSNFKKKAKEAVKKVRSIFSKPKPKPVKYTPPPKSVRAPRAPRAPTIKKTYTPTSSMPGKPSVSRVPSVPSKRVSRTSKPAIQATFTPLPTSKLEAVSPTVARDVQTGALMSMDTSLLTTKAPTVKSSKGPTVKIQKQSIDFSRGLKEGVDVSSVKGLKLTGSKKLVSTMIPVDYKVESPKIRKREKVKQPALSDSDVASFLAATPTGITAKPAWMTEVQWQAYTASGKNIVRAVQPRTSYRISRARRIGGGTVVPLGKKTQVSRQKVEQYLGPSKKAPLPTGFVPKRKFMADVIYGRSIKQKPADIWKKIW